MMKPHELGVKVRIKRSGYADLDFEVESVTYWKDDNGELMYSYRVGAVTPEARRHTEWQHFMHDELESL